MKQWTFGNCFWHILHALLVLLGHASSQYDYDVETLPPVTTTTVGPNLSVNISGVASSQTSLPISVTPPVPPPPVTTALPSNQPMINQTAASSMAVFPVQTGSTVQSIKAQLPNTTTVPQLMPLTTASPIGAVSVIPTTVKTDVAALLTTTTTATPVQTFFYPPTKTPASGLEGTTKNPFTQAGDCEIFCLNHGVCRVDNSIDQFRCICTLDYTGQMCQNSRAEPLTSCFGVTCENSGECVETETAAMCSCTGDTVGSRCERRSHSYQVDAALFQSSKKVDWLDNQTDPASAQSASATVNACPLFQAAVQLGVSLDMSSSFLNCTVINLQASPATVSALLTLDSADLLGRAYTPVQVRDQLVSGGRREMDRNAYYNQQIAPDLWISVETTFKVMLLNPCVAGRHDCSPNADCIVETAEGGYTCQCHPFTMDNSPNSGLPGRRCAYDGLIILICLLVGVFLSASIVLFCGFRRSIWRRPNLSYPVDAVSFSDLPKAYEI